MNEEKVLLEMNEKEPKKIPLGEAVILVKPYIAFEDKIAIAQAYIESLFGGGDTATDYISARYVCMHGIVDVCTNIDIEGTNMAEIILSHGYWGKIKAEIENYDEFMSELDCVVEMIMAQSSFSKKLSDLVDMAMDFLSNISQLDFSDNGISEMLKQFNELQKEMSSLNETIGAKNPVATPKKRGRPAKKKVVSDEQES